MEAAELSPFLDSLLHPPETVPLPDATRVYRTMDVVEPCVKFHPEMPNVSGSSDAAAEPLDCPICRAHAEGKLWTTVASRGSTSEAENEAPGWFVKLCSDLFYRTSSDTENQRLDDAARRSNRCVDGAAASQSGDQPGNATPPAGQAAVGRPERASSSAEVDPYLWLPFDLFDVKDYRVGPYVFPAAATYTAEQREKLCLGHLKRCYIHFANTYCFPDRAQLPTSLGTEPARLYIDPLCPVPLVYIQLSPDFPPALWLPVRPTADAIRRVLSAFAIQATLHRDSHHAAFEQRYAEARRVMELQRMPLQSEGDVLRFMSYEARNALYLDAPLREYENEQELFLGEYDDPERLLEHIDLCPFLFAIPHLRTVVQLHAEHMTPTIDGPGVAISLYRLRYSKALLQISVQLSAEVKLPPQDPEAFHFLWKDAQAVPKMKIPVFARVIWPTNQRLSGGGGVVSRFNSIFGTEFAADMPVDGVAALWFSMQWIQRLNDFMGVAGMRRRVAELEAAMATATATTSGQCQEAMQLYPGTREIPNPEYTLPERVGMHLQYLSHLGDPSATATILAFLPSATAPVRMGCAKAALIAGDRELFRRIVSSEPPGRIQHYMTRLVRKRKTRDLVDPEPRLLEDQYEFAAPLWTKRGTRIDRNTVEGAVDAARLLR